jgi:hypothetical protein
MKSNPNNHSNLDPTQLNNGEQEEVGVRFHKGDGTEKEPEYIEGFSNKPKLNRTPKTTLTMIPGEFEPPPERSVLEFE